MSKTFKKNVFTVFHFILHVWPWLTRFELFQRELLTDPVTPVFLSPHHCSISIHVWTDPDFNMLHLCHIDLTKNWSDTSQHGHHKHWYRHTECRINTQWRWEKERKEKLHTHQWPPLNLVPLSEAQTANERTQSRPFKFIWTDVIKLTHGVGWILGRLLPKLSFPKHCHLPSLQMNQLQSSIILLEGRWMHTSPLAGAGRLKGLIGAGDIKAGGFICHIRTTANHREQAAVPALAVLADTMKYVSKW